MNKLDTEIINMLIKDGRISFADMARELDISRAHARSRVQALVEEGVIEQFTAVTNPKKLGKLVSSYLDLKVKPAQIDSVAEELASLPEVVSLYIMSDLKTLHIHTLTESYESFSLFVQNHVFGRPEILSAESHALLKRVKHRRGGSRL